MLQKIGKKTLAKLLSVLLAFSLILSYLPVPSSTAFAEDEYVTGKQTAEETGRDTTKDQVRVIVENTTYTDMVYPADVGENTDYWYGTLVDQWVELDTSEDSEDTMMSCIVKALTEKSYSQEGADGGYISSIEGLGEFYGGLMSGWMGTLNDWFTNEGFNEFTVADGELETGDIIKVMYTCSDIAYGKDLGLDWSDNTKTLKALEFSTGNLNPVFAEDITNYTLTVPSDTTTLKVTPTATNKNFLVKTFIGETEYKRTTEVPVSNGTVITVKCGDPSWPTMNNASEVAPVTYTITVAQESSNHAPVLKSGVSATGNTASVIVESAYALNLGNIFEDADENDTLTYQVKIGDAEYVTANEDYSYTPEEAGETTLVFKANDGKVDSTDTYAVTLTAAAEATTLTVKAISNTVNVSFYYDAARTQPVDASLITDSGIVSYYHQYVLTVPAGTYYYTGVDGEQTLGGDYLTVSDDATVTLYRDNIAFNGSALTEEGDYTFTFKNPDENDVQMGASYVSSGKKYTPTLIELNKQYSGQVTLAEKWTEDYYVTNNGAFIVKNISATSAKTTSLPIEAYKQIKVTAPEGATVTFYKQEANYVVTDRTSEAERVDNGDGTITYIVGKKGTTAHSNYQYRATMEGKVTEAGYLTDGTPVTVSFLTDKTPSTQGSTNINGSERTDDDSGVLLNIDDTKDTNELALKVGETFKLRAWRAAWEIINTTMANQMIEPDFHYAILSGEDVISMEATNTSTKGDTYCSGNASSNWMNITAQKEGTAVVAVWYDAINITGSTIGGFFGATDPSRYGVFVVNVGEDSTVEWNPVTSDGDWDAEFDTVYYTGENGYFTIKPEDVASISVQNIYGSTAGGVQTVASKADDSYKVPVKVPVKSGANVITATKTDGTKDYYVVRANEITYSITNNTTEQTIENGAPEISTGDSVTIKLNGLQIPIPKMSGIYNPGYRSTGKILYKINDSTTLTSAGTQYDFAHSDNGTSITFTADVAGENNLSGYISLSSMGDDFGNHRNTTDEGKAVNTNASNKAGQFGSLPDISFSVTHNHQDANYDGICDSDQCQDIIGTIKTASVDYTSQYEGAYLHAPKNNVSVSSNLAELYGYEDSVSYLENVSALDVLVQAHLDVYGENFTKAEAADYLTLSYGSPDKMFGVSTYGGFFLNHAYPNDGTESGYGGYNGTLVSTQPVEDGDLVEFYFYEDAGYNDTYNWFVGTTGYSRAFTADQDMDLTLSLKGVGTMSAYLYKDAAEMVAAGTAIANAQIYTINPENGAKTDIEGAVTDENGSVTLNFAEPGEYIIAAYGTENCANKQIMTMTTVQVNPTLVLSANTEAVKKDEEVKVSVGYEGTINGFQMALSYDKDKLEYISAEWGFDTEEEGTDPSVVINPTEEGIIYMNATQTSAMELDDNKIVTMTFKANAIGTANFNLSDVVLSAPGSEAEFIPTIDNQIINGVTAYEMGDVNMDGRVSIVDANMVQLSTAQLKTLNAAQTKAADVYQDEEVSILDVNRIQIFLAHLVDVLVIIP